MSETPATAVTPFPVARWVALAWTLPWGVTYAFAYPWINFLNLCDLAVILTCWGLWRGSALLLSSQAVSALVVDTLWTADVLWRLVLDRHLIGGTEYMFDPALPLALRLLSLFHVVWPLVLLAALRRTGYDPRGFALQVAIAAVAFLGAGLADPVANVNFAHAAPIFDRPLGPAPVHLAASLATLVLVVYVPTHVALRRLFPDAERKP